MSRIAFVNGQYRPQSEAMVHIEDRGYQFSDGVYEVCEVFEGALIDDAHHRARLTRSLNELRIAPPLHGNALLIVLREVIRRNHIHNGFVYVQVTRGVAPRDHGFPAGPVKPSLVVTARSVNPAKGNKLAGQGVSAISQPDIRWKRVDIKSLSLLPNVLAKQAAREQGAYEAWLVDEQGRVTEGSSSNAWIVTAEGVLITRQVDHAILSGVTRTALLGLAAELQMPVEERAFTLEEAFKAREAFISASTTLVMPVVSLDGRRIGDGKPGPVATRLRSLYHNATAKTDMRALHR